MNLETQLYEVRPAMATKGDVLKFRNTDGNMELLPTDFADRLEYQIQTYLREQHSIPAFLASVTLLLVDS